MLFAWECKVQLLLSLSEVIAAGEDNLDHCNLMKPPYQDIHRIIFNILQVSLVEDNFNDDSNDNCDLDDLALFKVLLHKPPSLPLSLLTVFTAVTDYEKA